MQSPARFYVCPHVLRQVHALAVLLALAVLPACAETQAVETDTLRNEVGRIESMLAEIEARALRDPELFRRDQVLGEELMTAMVEADRGLAAAAAQLPLLQDRYSEAIQAGDAAAAAEVNRRIAAIEERYLRAQEAALREPSLAERVERFNALLRRRMIETDVAAADLLECYAELRGRMVP